MEEDGPGKVVNTPMKLMLIGGGLILLGPLLFFFTFLISSLLGESQVTGLFVLAPLSFFTGLGCLVVGTLSAVVNQVIEDGESSNSAPHFPNSDLHEANSGRETSPSFARSSIYSVLSALVLTSLSYAYGTSESFMAGFALILPLCLFAHLAFYRRAKTLFAFPDDDGEEGKDYFNP